MHNAKMVGERKIKEKNQQLEECKAEVAKLKQEVKDLEAANLDLEVEKGALQDELNETQRCSRFYKEKV